MSLLDFIWNLFRKPETSIYIPTTEIIRGDDIRLLLKPFTDNLWISDETYSLVNTDSLTIFLERNPVHKRKYLIDSQDCDDFSFELMGDVDVWYSEHITNGAFGIVWGNKADGAPHAWNFFISANKKVWFVEPQNDKIFVPTTEKVWIMIV